MRFGAKIDGSKREGDETKVNGDGCRVQGAGCRVQGTGYWVLNKFHEQPPLGTALSLTKVGFGGKKLRRKEKVKCRKLEAVMRIADYCLKIRNQKSKIRNQKYGL